MRTFIAINLPQRERLRIHRALKAVREEELPVRWVDPENMHLTLKFLGEVRPDRLDPIRALMERVAGAMGPLALDVGGFGAFPTLRRPRVLWMGVEATPELRCLKQDLEWALADEGFEAETRAFHPHLTLGRANPDAGAGVFRDLDTWVPRLDFRVRVHVPALDLMRSQLSKLEARYTVLSSARFQGA